MDNLGKIKNTACYLFDLDGTVYLGDALLPGARELLTYLDEKSRPYFFLTNNSSRSRTDYVTKLAGYGLDVPLEKIFSSGMATAIYLQNQKPNARVYLVGTPSLEEEFRSYGFDLVDVDPDYAVLGFDTTLTYQKVWKLCDMVVEGIPYIATHPDINCPTPDGFMPDIGAMMAMMTLQMGLGIVTVINAAPLGLGLAHQLGAVALWVLILRARHHAAYPVAQSIRGA
jgi:HAD superfamily hydrolase (TIGR01450 family)